MNYLHVGRWHAHWLAALASLSLPILFAQNAHVGALMRGKCSMTSGKEIQALFSGEPKKNSGWDPN